MNIFLWNWACCLNCFAFLSVHLKSWINLFYSAELSPVYLRQELFHQLLKCKTRGEKAVLWLHLWPKGQAFSKYDFIQVVRARAGLRNKNIGLRQAGELSFFCFSPGFVIILHTGSDCLPAPNKAFLHGISTNLRALELSRLFELSAWPYSLSQEILLNH